MGVDSYLELFTTLYGWFFSSVIWSVLSSSGIIYIPFLVTIVQVWREGHEMDDEAKGTAWMIRRMEIELISAIVVFALCLVPSSITSLSSMSLYYAPAATVVDPAPHTATVGAPDSSYGGADVFGTTLPSVAAIPPWWYTILGISSGINAATRAGIQGGIRDFRQLEDLAHIATIDDPQLRSSIQRFYSECFVPARSRFLVAGAPSSVAAAQIAVFGATDTDWIGSHAFRADPMLYADLYARSDVVGFAFDPSRDADVNTAAGTPALGRPSCKQWWEEDTIGLRDQLRSTVGAFQGLAAKVSAVLPGVSAEETKDWAARLAYQKTAPTYIDSESPSNGIGGNEQGFFSRLAHMPANLAGAAGTGWQAFQVSASMKPLIYCMTIAQPLILMAMYIFLPIVLVCSRYNLSVMFVGAIGIFAVKFWTVMWYIARWMDDNLIASMYPGAGGSAILEFLADNATTENTYKRIVLNAVLMLMYIGLPILFSAMMAWVGINIGQGVQRMLGDAVATGRDAGRQGSELAAAGAKGAKG